MLPSLTMWTQTRHRPHARYHNNDPKEISTSGGRSSPQPGAGQTARYLKVSLTFSPASLRLDFVWSPLP